MGRLSFLSPSLPVGRRVPRRCRSCCTCSSASRSRASGLPRCGCCEQAPVEHTRDAAICASCCCWRCALRRCCCSRFAFARPFLADRRGFAISGLTIVALDTSFSLSAPGQFESARDAAPARRSPARSARSGRRGHVRRRRRGRGAAIGRPRHGRESAVDNAAAGFGATRYRARSTPRPSVRWPPRHASSSSPIFRTAAGTPAIDVRCPSRARDRRRRSAAAELLRRRGAHVGRPDYCGRPERRG